MQAAPAAAAPAARRTANDDRVSRLGARIFPRYEPPTRAGVSPDTPEHVAASTESIAKMRPLACSRG
jgi:hypothetical protein